MNIRIHRKFIRKASFLIKTYSEYHNLTDPLASLPQRLSSMGDTEVLDQSHIYLEAISHLAREGMRALANRDGEGKVICEKAAKLVNCYQCGSIPNRL